MLLTAPSNENSRPKDSAQPPTEPVSLLSSVKLSPSRSKFDRHTDSKFDRHRSELESSSEGETEEGPLISKLVSRRLSTASMDSIDALLEKKDTNSEAKPKDAAASTKDTKCITIIFFRFY